MLRRIRQCHESAAAIFSGRLATKIVPWEFDKHPSIDPYLAAILLLTPHLEELSIASFNSWSVNQGCMTLQLPDSPPMFHLKKLSLSRFVGSNFNILPILMLPSLRTVEVENVSRITFANGRHDSNAKSSVEHLHLVGQSPQTLQVAKFPSVLRDLKTFSVHYRNPGAWLRPKDFTPLTDLLHDHCHSLEYLSFEARA